MTTLQTSKNKTDDIAIITSVQPAILTEDKTSKVSKYQQLARQKNLANHHVWQRLFYVNRHQLSDVTYQDFFLSANGKTNLAGEMDTTIDKLLTDTSEQSPQCRFPARSEWLIKTLNIQATDLATVECREFRDWFSKINPHTMTLVFATDYMGNPSSMFGHTLLRIDPPQDSNKSKKNMDLVAYALNYAAITPTNENSAMYAYKGLTGKYGGEYGLMKYFYKTKEYGDLESRDMWEYELDLPPQDVQFLVKHIWEMKHVHFPYYFLDKNCSYALLGLMDLVHPELNLQSQFSWTVVPIETIKAIKKAGLIRKQTYRPALQTKLKTQEKYYGKDFSQLANQLTQPTTEPNNLLAKYDITKQAGLLEMAYDSLYFQQATQQVNNKFAGQRLRDLLVKRSELDVPKQRIEPKTPEHDPTQGHGAKSWGIGIGQIQQHDTLTLQHRVAYHGLSDPQTGYNIGQLLFLNGGLQIQHDKVRLEYLDILSVNAVNPITSYQRPRSWGTDIGYHQIAIDDQGNFSETQTHGVGVLAGQIGYSKALLYDTLMCGSYLRGEMQVGKALADNIRLGVSPKIQCSTQSNEKWQANASLAFPFWSDKHKWQTQLNAELQYNVNPQNALRLTATHEAQGSKNWQKLMLGYQHYY